MGMKALEIPNTHLLYCWSSQIVWTSKIRIPKCSIMLVAIIPKTQILYLKMWPNLAKKQNIRQIQRNTENTH